MTLQSEIELVDLAVNWVREHGLINGLDGAKVTADTDLLDGGLLDSVGFVDLILFIEAQSGCKIDLTDIDPAELSVLSTLCRVAFNTCCRRHDPEEASSQSAIQVATAIMPRC
jgi:acyl carrier protein